MPLAVCYRPKVFVGLDIVQCLLHIIGCVKRITERNRVFHRELGTRADRKMCCVRAVTEENKLSVIPAFATHRWKLSPDRTIGQQRMSLKFFVKQRFAISSCLSFSGLDIPDARHASSVVSTMKVLRPSSKL